MAGRTSTSFGVGATITILGLTTLGFFVAFAVFYGKFSNTQRLLQQAQQDQSEVVKADERNRDDVRNLIEAAKQERKSLVAYLVDAQGAVMTRVTGTQRDKLSDLNNKIKDVPGAETQSMLAVLNTMVSENASLRTQLEQADTARKQALADRQNEVDRVAAIEQRHSETLASITADVGKHSGEINEYRVGADTYKKNVDAQLDKIKQDAAESDNRYKKQLEELLNENLIIRQQLATLRGQKNQGILQAGEEAALVDAEIIGTDSAERQAFLSIGRRQNVVLGMTFAVYASAAAIRPNEEGNYPPGKATLEVISVGETSSTCRITSEVRGNPVVKGDVVANAVYDPHKRYTFVVFGNFDANRDGIATTLEREDIITTIRDWGGKIADDLTGEADFLVLGERPVLPPRPGANDPFEVVQEFRRRQADVTRYENLFKQAGSTSVPILNENRLYTLIGKSAARSVAGR